MTSLQKAIIINANDAYAYTALGNVLYRLERFEESISAYEKAVELKSDLPSAYAGLGQSLIRNIEFGPRSRPSTDGSQTRPDGRDQPKRSRLRLCADRRIPASSEAIS